MEMTNIHCDAMDGGDYVICVMILTVLNDSGVMIVPNNMAVRISMSDI